MIDEPIESRLTQDFTKAFHEVIKNKGINYVDYCEDGFEFSAPNGKRFRIIVKEVKPKSEIEIYKDELA